MSYDMSMSFLNCQHLTERTIGRSVVFHERYKFLRCNACHTVRKVRIGWA